jgi:glycosyltransferase involved in cell wall biosynthesis
LTEILSDPEKLKKMAETGRKAVEEKYDSRKLSLRVVELYNRTRNHVK